LRAHHHHRNSLVSYKKIKGPDTSYDEPSFRRWCKPPTEKTEKVEKIPRGSLPVYVGPHEKRFVIPMAYLTMPDFESLMETAAEEFGFKQEGGLKIPCDEDDFKEILSKCLANHKATLITRNRKWARVRFTTLKSIGGLTGTASKEVVVTAS